MGTQFQFDETQPSVSKPPAISAGEFPAQTILTALSDNVVVLDAAWRIRYINHVSPGLDESQVIGSEWLPWIDEQDRPRAIEALRRTLASGESIEIEFRAVGPHHEMTWFQVKFARLTGEPSPQVVLIAQDITERKRAEQTVRENQARYQELFDGSADALFVLNAAGQLLDANQTAVEWYGYPRAELLELNARDLAAPDLREQTPPRVRQSLASGAQFEWRHRRKDGTEIPVEISARPITLDGQPCVLSSVRDISERKRVEAQHAQNLKLLETVADAIPDVVYLYDPRQRRHLYFNREMATLLGYSNAEIQTVGADLLLQQVHPADLPKVTQHIATLAHTASDAIFPLEYRIQGKGGDYRWFYVRERVYQRNAAGQPEILFGVCQDVTERKCAEDTLRARSQELGVLLEASRALAETLQLDTVLQIIAEKSARILGLETAAVYLVEQDDLYLGATSPPLPPDFPAEFRAGKLADHPHIQQAVVSGESVIVPDTVSAALTPAERAISDARNLRSILYVPLMLEQKPVGVLIVAFTRAPGVFTPAGIALCAGFAHQATLALTNAKLYADSKQYALKLEEHITQQRRAEAQLQNSEAQYRLLFQNNPNPMWVYDPDTLAFLAVNDAAVRHYGYTREEFLTMTIKDIRPREDIPALEQEVAQLPAGLNQPKTWRHCKKDGALINVEITSHWSEFAGKRARIVLANDVTERVRAEQALRESEASLRESQRVAHVGHWVWETPTNQVTWSHEMKRIFGLDPATFDGDLNEIIARAIHPDDQAQVYAANQAVLTEQKPAPIEYRVVLPDQSVRTIWAVPGDPVVDAGGNILKLTGIVQDITERKHAELNQQQLTEERDQHYQRLQLILDRMPIACVMNDVDFNVVYWNRAAETIFGFSAAEMLGKQPYGAFIPLEVKPYVEEIRLKMIRENSATLGQNENRTKDGRTIFCEWHNTPLHDRRGHLVGFLGMAQDVTARRRAEERVQRQVEHLNALRAIDVAIGSNFNLNITLDILLKHVVEQLKVDAAAALLFNPNMLMLEFAAGLGFRSPAIRRAQVRLGDGVAGKIALERRSIHLADLARAEQPFARRIGVADEGFRAYVGVPLIAKGQIKGVLEIFHRAPLTMTSEWMNFLEMLAGQAAIAVDSAQLFEGLERSNLDLGLAYDATIEGWSRALDLRDRETEGHTQRVVAMTLRLARTLGAREEELVHYRRGALLHDIGKLGVPDAILFKPDKLTEAEWRVMRQHPMFAHAMLAPISYLHAALDIPYCHHEKWDGTGYPRQLKGEQIPLSARIFAIVDVWDALRSDRPYRRGWEDAQVSDYLRAQAGAHFDPRVVDAFFKLDARTITLT